MLIFSPQNKEHLGKYPQKAIYELLVGPNGSAFYGLVSPKKADIIAAAKSREGQSFLVVHSASFSFFFKILFSLFFVFCFGCFWKALYCSVHAWLSASFYDFAYLSRDMDITWWEEHVTVSLFFQGCALELEVKPH